MSADFNSSPDGHFTDPQANPNQRQIMPGVFVDQEQYDKFSRCIQETSLESSVSYGFVGGLAGFILHKFNRKFSIMPFFGKPIPSIVGPAIFAFLYGKLRAQQKCYFAHIVPYLHIDERYEGRKMQYPATRQPAVDAQPQYDTFNMQKKTGALDFDTYQSTHELNESNQNDFQMDPINDLDRSPNRPNHDLTYEELRRRNREHQANQAFNRQPQYPRQPAPSPYTNQNDPLNLPPLSSQGVNDYKPSTIWD